MIIYRINAILSEEYLKVIVREIEAEEKPRSYILNRDDDSSPFQPERLNKGKMMKVESIFKNVIPGSSISFHIYCLREDKQRATDMVIQRVISRFKDIKKTFDAFKAELDKRGVDYE